MIQCLLYITMSLVLAQATPDEAVESGRDALDRRWSSYPWYDAEKDGVKPIEVSAPPAPREYSGDFSTGSMTLLKWLIWLLLITVVVVVVFLLLRAYFRDGNLRWAKHAPKPGDDEHRRRIEALPFPVKATKLDFLSLARQLYEQGQYGEAVKYLFSYQLVQLDKHRIVRLTRGKTNRQYVREIVRRDRRPLAGLIEQTMLVFEDFFFGNHPIDRLRFEAVWSRLSEFETHVKGETG